MNSLIKKLSLVFAGFSISQASQANTPRSIEENMGVNKETKKFFNECSLLVELNNNTTLTEKQVELGNLIHDIIVQIADDPIEYCEKTAMFSVIESPELMDR